MSTRQLNPSTKRSNWPALKWYADHPARRARQIALDLTMVALALLWVRLSVAVQDTVLRLQEPGRQLEDAGDGLAQGLRDAADRVAGTPLVGDALADPLSAAANAGSTVGDAGAAANDVVAQVALVLALAFALLPLIPVLGAWLFHRLWYVREATAAVKLRGDTELMALRAAANMPLRSLARLGPEPVARWRRGEAGAAEDLAALQLRELGVRT